MAKSISRTVEGQWARESPSPTLDSANQKKGLPFHENIHRRAGRSIRQQRRRVGGIGHLKGILPSNMGTENDRKRLIKTKLTVFRRSTIESDRRHLAFRF